MQNVEDYINAIKESSRKTAIESVRTLIKNTLGEHTENMAYNMPTYFSSGQCVCALANQKQYMSLYIMPYDLLERFQNKLIKFNRGKSCIRFRKIEDEDLDLFKEIIDYCNTNYSKSKFFGRMNPKS